MDNKSISKVLHKTAQLLELHEANPFKVRSYQNAAFNLERLTQPLVSIPMEQWKDVNGIGKNLNDKLADIVEKGTFNELEELIEKTPTGILELLEVKGVGPKKIRQLWLEYKIENVDDLLIAAQEGKLAKWKGFGEKTQKTILENLLFSKKQSGKIFFSYAEQLAQEITENLSKVFTQIAPAGEVARYFDVVEKLQFVVVSEYDLFFDTLEKLDGFEIYLKKSGPYIIRGIIKGFEVQTEFILSEKHNFGNTLMYLNSDIDHLNRTNETGLSLSELLKRKDFENEVEIYRDYGTRFIPAEIRDGMVEWDLLEKNRIDDLISDKDLRGTLHNHSTYSDGKNSLKEMALGAKELGLEYLGISDHSKSAFYANGLIEERIEQQHAEIDILNKDLAPFKIFKGIESDILNDGSLDYDDTVLASFDFIVASIHSGLSMDEKKATERLLRAIENPYTTILGHPTGRLLLKRKGYPINHKMIIDACAQNNVIIEINANPWRLDLSWEWVAYALEQGVMLSINPDAHELKGYKDMHYGVCVGRKGGLTKSRTFNALSAEEVENYFNIKKAKASN